LLEANNKKPYNNEIDNDFDDFKFTTNLINHTYLKAPDGRFIFVRERICLDDNETI